MEENATQVEAPHQARPQSEHRWLEQLVGEWRAEMHDLSAGASAPSVFHGVETVRSLGGLWFVAEGRSEMPGGGTGTTIMTLGYDPERGRYVGTWIGSMMAVMFSYEGTMAGAVLTLDTEGPDFAVPGQRARYRDVIELRGPDERLLRSYQLRSDGEWLEFMRAQYTRVK